MRDFFARQELARSMTGRLLLLFALAVLLLILLIYLAVRGVWFWHTLAELDGAGFPWWDPLQFLAVAGAILLLIAGGSWYKIRELRGGGCRVAESLGGRLVPPASQAPEERRLLNVVEEMAIASGIPVPDTYILDRERGINAFAAGFGLDDAVICVTTGALHHLRRHELQGVIAHEFSHLLNGDTLINIRLIGWLHGLLLIGLTGEGILRGLGRLRSRSGGAFIVLGFALYVLGYLGVFLGNLIKSAVSRQREYLADASAVQFTRDSSGLAGALKKIGGLLEAGRLSHARALEASHLYFCSTVRESLPAFLATHPPLLERILQLEPQFDGVFPPVEPLPSAQAAPPMRKKPVPARREPVEVVSGAAAAALLESVGAPMREHGERAEALIAGLPPAVLAATREQTGACALIYTLLLDREPAIRGRQLEILRGGDLPVVVEETERLAGYLPELSPQVRLPLMDLALPALRRLSPGQYRNFKAQIERLALADGKHTLFEFALSQALLRHLGARFEPPRQVAQIYSIRGAIEECSCVLSLLARVGHRGEEEAKAAFDHGRRILLEPGAAPEFLPTADCAPSKLSEALALLAVTSPPIKRKVLAACLECLMHDGEIRIEETELFRAVADALGCPVPPWLTVLSPSP